MVGEPQGAMCVVSQIWQVVFASQTLPVFCLAFRKKAQCVVMYKGEGDGFPQVRVMVNLVSPSLLVVSPSTKSVLAMH